MSPAAHARGAGDARGSTRNRRARKAWLLSLAAGHGGNGWAVPCRWCGRQLTAETLTVDRFPICGHSGGRYVRGNIVPACERCNFGGHPSGQCRAGGQSGPVQLQLVEEVARAG